MDGFVIAGFAALVVGGMVMTTLILWLIGRIWGQLASGIADSGSIAYLIDYAVSAYMSCGPPSVCDTRA